MGSELGCYATLLFGTDVSYMKLQKLNSNETSSSADF